MPHVIFVAPDFPANQRRFVEALKHQGARVTGIGDAPVEHLGSELESLLDGYERVGSVTDAVGVTRAVKRIQAQGPWVDRLEATIESHMLPVAEARQAASIPGLSVDQVMLCRDKYVMKEFLRSRGIPCARSHTVESAALARAFAEDVGYPVILKPKDGMGAQGTARIDGPDQLDAHLGGSSWHGGAMMLEAFVEGHEGFYDTLTCDGSVTFEAVTHYFPNVLEAMRVRWISPQMVHTNRLSAPGYAELRHFGRVVIDALALSTTATHMEWFASPKGLVFSEIGARPPGCNHWDMYSEGGGFDLYAEWARAVLYGEVASTGSDEYATGLINIRPSQDGHIRSYSGLEEIEARHGEHIFQAHLPSPGTPTQPVEAGYLANAYFRVKHRNYDQLRQILDDIGQTVRLWAG